MGSIGDVESFVDAAGLSLEDLTDVDNDDLQALFDELQVTSVKLKLQIQANWHTEPDVRHRARGVPLHRCRSAPHHAQSSVLGILRPHLGA